MTTHKLVQVFGIGALAIFCSNHSVDAALRSARKLPHHLKPTQSSLNKRNRPELGRKPFSRSHSARTRANAAPTRASVKSTGRTRLTKENLETHNQSAASLSQRSVKANSSSQWGSVDGHTTPSQHGSSSEWGSVDGHTTPSQHGSSSEWGSIDGHTTPSQHGSSSEWGSIDGHTTPSEGGDQVFYHEPSLRSTRVGSSKSTITGNSSTSLSGEGIHTSNAAAQKYQELASKKSPMKSAGEYGVSGGRVGPPRPPVSGALAKEGQIAKPYGVQGGRIGPPKAANSNNWEMGPWKAAPKTNTTSGGGEKSPSGYGGSGGMNFQPLGSY